MPPLPGRSIRPCSNSKWIVFSVFPGKPGAETRGTRRDLKERSPPIGIDMRRVNPDQIPTGSAQNDSVLGESTFRPALTTGRGRQCIDEGDKKATGVERPLCAYSRLRLGNPHPHPTLPVPAPVLVPSLGHSSWSLAQRSDVGAMLSVYRAPAEGALHLFAFLVLGSFWPGDGVPK